MQGAVGVSPERYPNNQLIRGTLPLRIYRYVHATYHRKGEEGNCMTGSVHMHADARDGGVPRRERSQSLRLFALGFAMVAALALALGAVLSAAQAAPQGLGALKQFRVPTADSQPRHITQGSDGNLWFTEGNEFFTPDPDPEMGGPSTTRSEGSRPEARSRSSALTAASAS